MKKKLIIVLLLLGALSFCLISCDGNIKHSKSIAISNYFNGYEKFTVSNYDFYNITSGYDCKTYFNKTDKEKLMENLKSNHKNFNIAEKGKIIFLSVQTDSKDKAFYGFYDCQAFFNGGIDLEDENNHLNIYMPMIYIEDAEKIAENGFKCQANSNLLINVDKQNYLYYLNNFSGIKIVEAAENEYKITQTRFDLQGKSSVAEYNVKFTFKDNQWFVAYNFAN